ncbi:MAG TPA: alpha/beta hydrolase [Nocardioidaceae bacterium]|nr:alpha/beta hydrolase [Nocardioidaceae bacterium]
MTFQTDVLGEPFETETIDLGTDDEGEVVATLVRRRATAGSTSARGAVLHVHGFCDYFFQAEMAQFWTDQGYDFYAVDLRKYGRSILPHQTPNFCRDLGEYVADLDATLHRITERDGHRRLVLTAHSTGGLIAPLWLDHRRTLDGRSPADAVILNSPWLDLPGSVLLRTAGTQAIDQIGLRRPYAVLPRTVSGHYGDSLHCDLSGEWEFNLAWKPRESFPVRAGWLRAVRRGHRQVHRGIDVGAPVLVLSSSRSHVPQHWDDEITRTDVVLDVQQIARWSHRLSSHVTLSRIDGAIHDVLASAEPVRKQAYDEIRRWLDYRLGD